MATVNTEDFARAFADALPTHVEEAKAAHAAMSIPLPSIDLASICAAWPKIKGFINAAIMVLGFFPGLGAAVPLVKAFVTAVDTAIMPALCPKA